MNTRKLAHALLILLITCQFFFQFQVFALKSFDITGLDPLYVGSVSNLGDSEQNPMICTSAGDLNGDGHEDIVIGSYTSYDNSIRTGLAYVIFGTATGIPHVDFDSLTITQGIRIRGGLAAWALGHAVEGLGDVNADGIDDIGIGAPGGNTVFIIFGKRTGLSDIDLSNFDNSQGIRIFGASNSYTGYVIKSAGDVNNDGVNDIVISAPIETQFGVVNAGAVYVIFGQSNGFPDMDSNDLATLSATGRGFKITGSNAITYLGMAVSRAGDMNKDGIADIMIGAMGASCILGTPRCGGVIVLYGSQNSSIPDLQIDSLTLSQGFKIIGSSDTAAIGIPNMINPAGDINNDGVDDIVIGAPSWTDSFGNENSGLAYIIYGKEDGILDHIDLAAFSSSQGFTMKGNATDSYVGMSATSGDIDGDGFNDLIISSPGANTPSNLSAGIIYVMFGGKNLTSDIDLADENSLPLKTFVFYGEVSAEPSYLGIVLNIAKDLNGDGINDIIAAGFTKVYVLYSNKCERGVKCSSVSPLCYAALGCSCGDIGLFFQDEKCVSQCSSGSYGNEAICERKTFII